MAKFYGQKEIKDIKECEDATIQEIIFSDDSFIIIPKIMVLETVSETPLDPTALRNKRCLPVAKDVLETFLKWDIHIDEVDFISQRVIMSINESLKKADAVLWKKEREDQTMSDVNRVIISAPTQGDIPSPYVGQ